MTRSQLAAADLFYEARLGLSGSVGYHHLYSELMDSAETLDYSSTETLNLEKACQAVNIRNNTPPGLTLMKSDGVTTVALLEDSGQLQLNETLIKGQTSINTGDGGLIIRDGDTILAFINASTDYGGEMKIRGSLTQNDLPGTTSTLLVLRYEGVPVTTLDKDGKLKIWGEVEKEHSF